MLDTLQTTGAATLGGAWPVVWTLLKIVAVLLPLRPVWTALASNHRASSAQ